VLGLVSDDELQTSQNVRWMVLVWRPVARACAPSKRATWAIVYRPGLDNLSSQAEKLFRSGLIMVGPDWLNETLRRGLVLWPRVDLVPVEFPVGSWHCWIWPWWISSQWGGKQYSIIYLLTYLLLSLCQTCWKVSFMHSTDCPFYFVLFGIWYAARIQPTIQT